MANRVLPPSLVREGDMMLSAVASDFKALPDVDVRALRDYRLRNEAVSADDIVIWPGRYGAVERIEALIGQFDALLIIAPETDDVLSSLCERFSDQDLVLLNSKVDSIKLTGNKYDTYRYLQAYDIPQIPTYGQDELKDIDFRQFVIKPVDGVGCEHLFLLLDRNDLERTLAEHAGEQFIIQPFIKGKHVSLSLLCWDGQCLQLSGNEQYLVEGNSSLVLKKCSVNAFDSGKFKSFSKKLIQALPGLRGYIGVDILITEEGTLLVEINPRLTTSYIGLRSALGINPAKLIMDCFIQQRLPRLEATQDNAVTVMLEADRAA